MGARHDGVLLSTEVRRVLNCCCVSLFPIIFGMLAMLLCMLVSVFILGVPWSRFALVILFGYHQSVLLRVMLGMGLLISNLITATSLTPRAGGAAERRLLPRLCCPISFQIDSMPAVILRAVTYIIPARYFCQHPAKSVSWPAYIPVVLGVNVLF